MKGYEKITLAVTLPTDTAAEAVTVNRDEPEFLSNVVLLALTRRAIYRGIRDRQKALAASS